MVSDLKAKEFCFMQKKSSRPSCFKAAMALFFAVVFFISGCSCGSAKKPDQMFTSAPTAQVSATPEPYDAESGEVTVLDGSIVKERITDSASALRAVESIAEHLGISDAAACYETCSAQPLMNDVFYSCPQEYNGVPVYGSSIDFIVDENGNCLNVTDNHARISGLNTNPVLTEEEAIQKALSNGASDVDSNGLCIYSCFDTNPCLTYNLYGIEDGTSMQYFVSAETGETVAEFCRSYTGETVDGVGYDRPESGIERHFNLYKIDNRFYLYDKERNIAVFNAYGRKAIVRSGGFIDNELHTYCYSETENGVIIVCDSDGNRYSYTYGEDGQHYLTSQADADVVFPVQATASLKYALDDNTEAMFPVMTTNGSNYVNNDRAVAAMSYAAYSYDFYSDIFGRNGFDNKGGFTSILFDTTHPNACSSNVIVQYASNGEYSNLTNIQVGTKQGMAYDVIGHEYTHSVEQAISCMLYERESGAVMEGLSDIFGELIEDYANNATSGNPTLTGSCDWKNESRNISNPEKSKCPAVYKGKYWKETAECPNEEGNDYGYVHNNSTVISHMAYLLSNGMNGASYCEALNNRQIAELYYRTIFMLPVCCSFNQFGRMLLRSAELMYERELLNAKQFTCVLAALNNSGIGVQNSDIRGMIYNVQPKCTLDIRGLDLTNCECTVKLSKIVNGNAAGGSQQPLEIILKGTINKPTEVDLSGGELFMLEIRNSGEEASNSEVYKICLSVDSEKGRPELVFYTMYGTVSPEITVDTNVQVAAGNSVSYAITEDGSLWEWGAKCGTRLAGNAAPKKILSDIVSVSTSGEAYFDESIPEVWTHTLAVAKDGSLYGWGCNAFGQITGTSPSNYEESTHIGEPTFMIGNIKQASAGGGLSAAVTTSGALIVWGGAYSEEGPSSRVIKTDVAAVEVGSGHSGVLFILNPDGTVEVMNAATRSAKKVMDGVQEIHGVEGYNASCLALKKDGSLWLIESGQFGDDTQTTRIMNDVISAAAYSPDLLEYEDEPLYVVNKAGQLLKSVDSNLKNFSVVMEGIVSVSAGRTHALAVTTEGKVVAWGNNGYGQLGSGVTVFETEKPVAVTGMNNALSVTVGGGGSFALVVKSDHSLWACGINDRGQLGNGTTQGSAEYIKIMDDVSRAEAEENFAFAVKQDGTLWAWGANDRGQLGDGTTIDRLSPVKVADGIADTNAYYALTTDGRMLEIGNGFAEAATGVSRIVDYNIAIMTDGTLWKCSVKYDDDYITGDVVDAWSYNDNMYYAIKNDGSLWDIYYRSNGNTKETKLAEGFESLSGYLVWTYGADDYLMLIDTKNDLYNGRTEWDEDGEYINLKKIAADVCFVATSTVTDYEGTHFCIDTSGQLYAFGKNYYGVFGKGRTAGYSDTPVTVAFPN
jgi:alpha-tubulin suppressor-like RCC1 family protein/Zn-dependent metalloprotease